MSTLSEVTLLGLVRDGFELSPYAARGIVMTMSPIEAAGNIRRDINMNLVNLGLPAARKYRFHLSCTDQESPGFAALSSASEGVWPGDEFELTCIPQLGAAEQQTYDVMVMSPGWQIQTDEYGAEVGWALDLEQL